MKTNKELAVEAINLLIEACGGKRKDFCTIANVQPPNLANYLNPQKVNAPAAKTLLKWAKLVYGEAPAFVKVWEGEPYVKSKYAVDKANTDGISGVYILYDSAFRVFYVGKATNLFVEIRQSLQGTRGVPKALTGEKKDASKKAFVRWATAFEIVRGDSDFRHDVEALLHLTTLNTSTNVQTGKFKRKS